MKKLLIISPYFPPVNAADMHRVRTTLPYLYENGWDAEVVTVDPGFTEMHKDSLLLKSIPANIKVHRVAALPATLTKKLGLGSIALRSLWHYRKYVDQMLAVNKFDLIYFSTTQFPVCILGVYWKKRFGVPYVIDMQDPWHSEYYKDKPKAQQPAKYWFSYRLNKYLEPAAIKNVSALISVSGAYIAALKGRYPTIAGVPASTVPFGMFLPDLDTAAAFDHFEQLLAPETTNLVYIGRGGHDMHAAIVPLFKAVRDGLSNHNPAYNGIHLYFIGTSYAPAGEGKKTIAPLADAYGLADHVTEITDRISFYHALATLQQADGLFIPGSDDASYTASKIYPYLMTQKPLLGIFNPGSPAISVLQEFAVRSVYNYDEVRNNDIDQFIAGMDGEEVHSTLPASALAKHSAQTKTALQCALFEQAINYAKT